jgi:hypothetical protein
VDTVLRQPIDVAIRQRIFSKLSPGYHQLAARPAHRLHRLPLWREVPQPHAGVADADRLGLCTLATHAGTYSIDGKREFASDDIDRARLDELIADYRQDSLAVESCPELLKATADQALVTDDNMGTEWRYFLHME